MWDELLCCFWSRVVFSLELPHGCQFWHFLLIVQPWNLNLDWGKRSLQFFWYSCGLFCDLLEDSLINSWSHFWTLATTGKVHHCSRFSTFVDNLSYCDLFEIFKPTSLYQTGSGLGVACEIKLQEIPDTFQKIMLMSWMWRIWTQNADPDSFK